MPKVPTLHADKTPDAEVVNTDARSQNIARTCCRPWAAGIARIRVGSGNIVEINPSELRWEVITAERRRLGTETTHRATFEVQSGTAIWTVTQYPPGTLVMVNTYVDQLDVIKDFVFGLECDANAKAAKCVAIDNSASVKALRD